MPQHLAVSTTQLRSLADTFGEAQIVALPSRVVLDLATRNYDTQGHLHRDSALASLSLETAIKLRDLLSEAITAAAGMPEVQPGLWSDATHADFARRRGRRAT